MNKISTYLQEHLHGEVVTNGEVLDHFSTDGSILELRPSAVIYPYSEVDLRKLMRFTWQLAERGKVIPITVRGAGTDQGGAAIGSGIVTVLPAHMNKILSLEPRKGEVIIQPGALFGKLQQALHTHYRFLPPYPSSLEYTTIGGAIGNNSAGEKSVKYGSMLQYVNSLRVVLANGEVIDTGRISKREVSKKMGEATMEGEIYRGVDAVLVEYSATIQALYKNISRTSSGYNIYDVLGKDGSIDLTPLFVGSQGTLGIITEATLATEAYTPVTSLVGGFFDDYTKIVSAVFEIKKLMPSVLEMIDEEFLNLIIENGSGAMKQILGVNKPKCFLLVEFDDNVERKNKKLAKKAIKILNKYAYDVREAVDDDQKDVLWKFRKSISGFILQKESPMTGLPFIEDAIVPVEQYANLIIAAKKLFEKYGLKQPMWGHVGDGVLSVLPYLDITALGDRQKIFKIMDEYYQLVISLGGSTSASANDGRIRGGYIAKVFGDDAYAMFQKLKQTFDPYGLLNPGVKIDVDPKATVSMLRQDYSLSKTYNHLPRY